MGLKNYPGFVMLG